MNSVPAYEAMRRQQEDEKNRRLSALVTAMCTPKPARRKKQPTADAMREQLALAADEIIELRAYAHEADQLITLLNGELRKSPGLLGMAFAGGGIVGTVLTGIGAWLA